MRMLDEISEVQDELCRGIIMIYARVVNAPEIIVTIYQIFNAVRGASTQEAITHPKSAEIEAKMGR